MSPQRSDIRPPFWAELWTGNDLDGGGSLYLNFGDEGAPKAAFIFFGEGAVKVKDIVGQEIPNRL